MKDFREIFLGVILSIASWETWENILVSILIAFLGGLFAAAGKAMYNRLFIRQKHEPRPFDSEPLP